MLLLRLLAFVILSLSFVWNSAYAHSPISDVITMLDADGGLRSGNNLHDGYYLVALSFSDLSDELTAKEDAKLAALRSISEFLNGVEISGHSSTSTTYISESKSEGGELFIAQSFSDVVESQFKGNIGASKVVKQGLYKGRYFVAIAITEHDTKNKAALVTPLDRPLFSEKGIRIKKITAKGVAKLGANSYKKAREIAIHEALRNAVQQANGVAIQGRSGRIGETITMAMSSNTQGYVRSYKVLEESEKRGQLVVVVFAEVDEAKLVKDVGFFLNAFSSPTFQLKTTDESTKSWLKKELEALGFVFQSTKSNTTHVFNVNMQQNLVENHLGKAGVETQYSIELVEHRSNISLFTLLNDVRKSKIYISPESRARQVSKIAALKSLKQQLAPEVISALAKAAERGSVYQIVICNANKIDFKIFKHVLNTATTGNVEGWQWDKPTNTLTLQYKYRGSLSEAMDQGLEAIYSTYKSEGKNRRPSSNFINRHTAKFTIKVKG